jgi:hypothetical protein
MNAPVFFSDLLEDVFTHSDKSVVSWLFSVTLHFIFGADFCTLFGACLLLIILCLDDT